MTISTPANFFSNIPDQLPEELFETIHEQSNIRIERIISKGQHNPENDWFDQPQDEWVLLLQGQARIEFAASTISHLLNPGDYLFIPAHVKHRVAWTDPKQISIWLAFHIFP